MEDPSGNEVSFPAFLFLSLFHLYTLQQLMLHFMQYII